MVHALVGRADPAPPTLATISDEIKSADKVDSATQYPITIVMMRFYPGQPLHPDTIKTLQKIETPIVMYCPPEDEEMLQKVRGALPITFVTRYSSPMEIGYNRKLAQLYGPDFWERQHQEQGWKKRGDRSIYTVKIWHARWLLVAMVAQVNPYRSQVFMYLDAGGIREQLLADGKREHPLDPYETIAWPSWSKVKAAVQAEPDRLLTGRIEKHWDDDHELKKTWIQSTWFAGTAATVTAYASEYYHMLFNMVADGRSVLSVERVLQQSVYRTPERFQSLTNQLHDYDTSCVGTWRVFFVQLMDPQDQLKSRCYGSKSWELVQPGFTKTEDIIACSEETVPPYAPKPE